MEICDIINHTEEGPDDAVKAIKKRLHQCMGRNSKTALYTLTILETCVKNCRLYLYQIQIFQPEDTLTLIKYYVS